MEGLEVLPVRGIGDVTAGDDLAALITGAAPWLRDGDVLVVTSKIVSKAEGRLVDVPADGPEREAARQEILAGETRRVVARRGPTAIVQTHHGFVMAAAGIDASNVDKTHLVLLPADPDASARALRAALAERGLRVGVIISDTMGRAWRLGLTDVALGAAGIAPLRDHKGEIDPYGNELQLTEMAVIDELAAAGELVKGKCDGVPVAVVRGYPGAGEAETPGAVVLLRDAESDMFSLGTAEARAEGLRAAATLPGSGVRIGAQSQDGPVPTRPGVAAALPVGRGVPISAQSQDGSVPTRPDVAAAVGRALAGLADLGETEVTADGIELTPEEGTPAGWVALGISAHRVRAALAAEGLASSVRVEDQKVLVVLE